jgi:hypothetical protein
MLKNINKNNWLKNDQFEKALFSHKILCQAKKSTILSTGFVENCGKV